MSNDEMDVDNFDENPEDSNDQTLKCFNPKIHNVPEGEELVADMSTYNVFNQIRWEISCLSFDFISDRKTEERKFPYSLNVVSGSQNVKGSENHLYALKLSNITEVDKDEELSDDEDENDNEDLPLMNSIKINHYGCVNRLRATKLKDKDIVATWSEQGQVYVYDITKAYSETPMTDEEKKEMTNFFCVDKHKDEGYALEWHRNYEGHLLSGDNKGIICHTYPGESNFIINSTMGKGHNGSVEDIQSTKLDGSSFISCGSDGSIIAWSMRDMKPQLICKKAHDSDVNVISWHPTITHTLVSGGDDGLIKVWDLRMFSESKFEPTEIIDYHKGYPITSLDFIEGPYHVVVASSEDNIITQWDLDIEQGNDEHGIPNQMLFMHLGEKEIKEVKFHKDYHGLIGLTSLEHFGLFRSDCEF